MREKGKRREKKLDKENENAKNGVKTKRKVICRQEREEREERKQRPK